jgi:hypothetical protein
MGFQAPFSAPLNFNGVEGAACVFEQCINFVDCEFAVFLEAAAHVAAAWRYGDAACAADLGVPAYVALVYAQVDGQPEYAFRIVAENKRS